jgi:putative membrane protein
VGLWAAVLAPRGQRGIWRVASSFAAVSALALLGMVLTTSSEPLSETYVERMGVEGAVTDQHNGAALMWVGGMALTLPLVMIAVWRWASAEEQAVRRREQLSATPH